MAYLTLKCYNNIKDYLHPNLHKIIKQNKYIYKNLICLPPYHGCNYKNKNGTRKLIDYGRGHRCITPSHTTTWKGNVKDKYFNYKYPRTRYLLNSRYRNLFKNKGNYVYNYNLKVYKPIHKSSLIQFFNEMKNYKNALSKEA